LVSELKAGIKVSQCNTNHKTPSILHQTIVFF
jgi:hypothetical protein